jgi:hypothetical protein
MAVWLDQMNRLPIMRILQKMVLCRLTLILKWMKTCFNKKMKMKRSQTLNERNRRGLVKIRIKLVAFYIFKIAF